MRPLLAAIAVLAFATPAVRAAECPPRPSQPVVAAHRGAAELAPENTIDAYRYAIAYGVDFIEADIHQSSDGRFVAFHDGELDAKSDGTGQVNSHSYAELRKVNVADNPKWRGSEFDPSRIPSLEEILQLAVDTRAAIWFDMKESLVDVPGFVAVVKRYPGVLERSVFLPFEPGRAAAVRSVAPNAQLLLSNYDEHIPGAVFAGTTALFRWFGSDLEEFDADKIAAIHAACGLVAPNVYDAAKADVETRKLRAALAIGADGAQINLPDVVAAALGRPVATKVVLESARACLVDARHGIGLRRKGLWVPGGTRVTDRHGCVPRVGRRGAHFAGDASARLSFARGVGRRG